MATAPAPVLTVTGIVHSIERFERVTNAETGESLPAARVTILTKVGQTSGGFVEVYVRDDVIALVDGLAQLQPVEWVCEVDAWKRAYPSDMGLPPAQRRTYATLRVSVVQDAAGARQAVKVA